MERPLPQRPSGPGGLKAGGPPDRALPPWSLSPATLVTVVDKCLEVIKLMLSANCVMPGLVDAGEKYDNPPVFQTLIFQFGTEWIVIINSEFLKRVTTVSHDDSCLGLVIPSFNKSWVAKLMSNNEAHNLFDSEPLAEDRIDLAIFSLLTVLR